MDYWNTRTAGLACAPYDVRYAKKFCPAPG
jgi:hypothetical protein